MIERIYRMAEEIAKSGCTTCMNPMVAELVALADSAGIEIAFDDEYIAVGDEVFHINNEW